MLRFEGVGVRLGAADVLADASLTVGAGQIVIAAGARGSGKSTLVAVAAAQRKVDAGAVFIGDRDVAALQPASLPYVRRNVGYLPARPALVAGERVLWNVALVGAARGQSPEDAQQDARRTLDDLELAAIVDESVDSLSDGTRRLVALARALVGAPPLVVLDDPLTGLGVDARDVVANALQAARAAGAAVLTSASDPDALMGVLGDSAQLVRLEGGRIVGGRPRIALVTAGREDSERLDDVRVATGEVG